MDDDSYDFKGGFPTLDSIRKAYDDADCSIPPGGDENAAVELLKSVSIHPLQPDARWTAPQWLDIGDRFEDFTPVRWERGLDFWRELHEVVDLEPAFEPYRMNYGQLAMLGIEKGKPFIPDARMRAILENAAALANDQLRVQSFVDRRPDRLHWSDRQWEWASLRPENGDFDLPSYKDLDARAKWFRQRVVRVLSLLRP